MGCLIEFFLEIVLEALIYVYVKLMMLVVPHKMFSLQTEKRVKMAITTGAVLLLLALLIGGILWLADIPFGRPMVLVSLGVIAAQILLGIVVKIVTKIGRR